MPNVKLHVIQGAPFPYAQRAEDSSSNIKEATEKAF